MNKQSFALVSGIVLAATSFFMPISANSVDIHQVSTQDTAPFNHVYAPS